MYGNTETLSALKRNVVLRPIKCNFNTGYCNLNRQLLMLLQ